MKTAVAKLAVRGLTSDVFWTLSVGMIWRMDKITWLSEFKKVENFLFVEDIIFLLFSYVKCPIQKATLIVE